MNSACTRLAVGSGILAGLWLSSLEAAQVPPRPTEPPCRISGRVSGAGMPLPGVAITVRQADTAHGATATGADGAYRLSLPYGTYALSAELTGFSAIAREVTVDAASCDQAVELSMVLQPRTARQRTAPDAAEARPRFEALEVRAEAAATTEALADPGADAGLLLPPGFGSEASADAIAVTGDSARVDRGLLDDRLDAIARGEFAFPGGEPPGAFGAGGGDPPDGRQGGPGAPGGQVGRGAGPRGGGPGGGPGAGRGAGGGQPGGRAGGPGGGLGRGGARMNATADYTFGGSALDSSPYELRPGAGAGKRPYTQQSFGATLGGPLKIPGVYDGTRRTNFTLGYNGGRGRTLFDRYATVPTEAMRAGDLSSVSALLVDPLTGDPFPGNQIPADRISPQAVALMRYLPLPNLSGTTRNYHHTTPTASVNDSVNVRLSHNFTTPQAGAGPAGRGGGGGGGGRGGRGGGQGRGTNVTLTTQLQFRRQDSDQANVFSTLGGFRESTTLGIPVTLNVNRGRMQHAINVNVSRTTSGTMNRFSGVEDVAGLAGISGASTSPFAWGVPVLSFSSITGLRDVTPSTRSDRRFSASYSWSRSIARHALRAGIDIRHDRSSSNTETNASGTFLFTGFSTAAGGRAVGADFADFLLGLPQQASVQYGPGNVTLISRSMNGFLMDDWRMRGNLTLNAGVRYELLWPYVEENGRLVNLDAPDDFSAAAPVMAGQTGAFSGEFPAGLLLTDRNNVAPRVGLAWRRGTTIVRGGYGVSYNSGAYASIARQLASQPPFAVTNTRIAELNALLLLEDALSGASAADTTNNFGVDKDYGLGLVQTWNVDVARPVRQGWNLGAGYTHTRGSSLDILRAPNRDADGLRIEGVQPFLWQSSEGSSVLSSATLRVQRPPVRGIGGQVSYTIARSRDNAPSIGGGGGSAVVAQDEQNLDAEWGLSNFDRRHRISGNLTLQLPFGENRPWLSNGGPWAAALENWRVTATFTAESGGPLTARVQAGARDAAQGTNGAMRADYSGGAVGLDSPTVDEFFNTSAFSIPGDSAFGSSPRNIIIGPGSRQLDAQLARDIRLGGTRALTIQLRATNVLNLVNYLAVDTSVNSPTFGEVLSVRPRRSAQLNLRFRF